MQDRAIARALLSLGLIAVCVSAAATQTAPAGDAARARWLIPARLTEAEVGQLLGETAAAINGRGLRIRGGGTEAAVDGQGRDVLFVILTGTLPVEDLGLSDGPRGPMRGVRAPATPPRSEVGAKQTLWIDVATRLPQRFEFAYEVPGLGDLAYDLVFD